MTIDDERTRTEGLGTTCIGIEVPAEVGLAALAEPVDVDDRDQVRELVVGSVVERLRTAAVGLQVPAEVGGAALVASLG